MWYRYLNERKSGGVIAAVAFILVAIFHLCISAEDDVRDFRISSSGNLPYISPAPGQIPIVASSPWVNEKPATLKDLKDIRDCGFNTVLTLVSLRRYRIYSPMLHRVGLKAIVGFPEFDTDSGIAIVDSLKQDPVIGGWRISDEPKETDFQRISEWYERVVKTDPEHLAYINMVGPEGKKTFFGDCPDYYSFLMRYQQIVHPSLLSYDLYPIAIKDGRLKVNYNQFYEALETNARMAAVIDRPFWAYCQSMAYSGPGVNRPAANLAYLSFEAFSALGYGAKGLVYWTYCLRKSNDRETYLSALVDLDYKKSEAWYAAQQVNKEIKALTDVFLNTTYGGTWHTGLLQPSGCQRFTPYTECLAKLKGGKKGFQISKLSDGDTNYLIIVNKDVEGSQTLSLTIDKHYDVVALQTEKSVGEYSVSEKKIKKNYKASVAPGRYLILRYNKIS